MTLQHTKRSKSKRHAPSGDVRHDKPHRLKSRFEANNESATTKTGPVRENPPASAAIPCEVMSELSGVKLALPALLEIQRDYLLQASALWNQAIAAKRAVASEPTDRRFSADDWVANPFATYTAQMYLLNAHALRQLADKVGGDEKTQQRIRFAVQQWIAAAAPSNFFAFNPEAQRIAFETKGQSIASGLRHLLEDIQRGHVSQTDESAFEVGRNLATTEGSVVFENELFQLIEYKPLTTQVYERALLIVPPCINKYYILDLQPKNSLIRYAVEQGHRVFTLSWCNPDQSMATKTWDDYVEDAVIRAINVVLEVTGTKEVNALGFCIGGTILTTALATLAEQGRKPVSSVTLLTTLLDFSDAGVLNVFIDETMVRLRETTQGAQSPNGGALLTGKELALTFNALRPDELVWKYVVGNYLKGQTPPPFDLLYWNSDNTNLPGPMFCWYLRNAYLENNLVQPGKLTLCGQKLDLASMDTPAYLYASREDHIVPWEGVYRSAGALMGSKRFVLGASGHIAGVINPPASNKRSYWVGMRSAAETVLPGSAQLWLRQAQERTGSWWPDWIAWLKGFSGRQVAAPKTCGNVTYKVIEPAPGRYATSKVIPAHGGGG